MQDREETSLAEVTERALRKYWTHPRQRQASAGDRTLKKKIDRTLRTQVTGRDDGTVHHLGNTFSTNRTLADDRPDAGAATSERV